MNLYLRGHDCRYAAEQMLLTLFPEERPEYPEGEPAGDRCELSLSRGGVYEVCSCRLYLGAAAFRGYARAPIAAMTGELEEKRLRNRIVKLAFYRAALNSGVPAPEWGSLTGVRPAKLMSAILRDGEPPERAVTRFSREYFVSPVRSRLALDAALASETARLSLGRRDVCLYVGIPFCPTRCEYCSFISASVEKSMELIEPYLKALSRELDAVADAVARAGLRVVSLYMGGGTPTTLSASQLDALCGHLARAFDLSALREYTVEAGRPDTITEEKLAVLRTRGVTRVSVNPQSMEDSVLEAIGRRHTARDIHDALSLTRKCGGFAVNMDLIAGLRSDTPEGFIRTLDTVLALAPENVTVHTLALKKGARLAQEETARLPSAGEVSQMLDYAGDALPRAGYAPYYLYRQKFMSGGFENVGWTVPGQENLYNICIMEELCGIISVGAGGSAKLTFGDGRVSRLSAPKYPGEYIRDIEKLCRSKERIVEFYGV